MPRLPRKTSVDTTAADMAAARDCKTFQDLIRQIIIAANKRRCITILGGGIIIPADKLTVVPAATIPRTSDGKFNLESTP